MSSVRNQYVYVSSKNRQIVNVYDFDINFSAGQIRVQDNEEMRMSLIQLSMPLSINQVNTSNNQIIFLNYNNPSPFTLSIPVGNWNMYDLATYVQNNGPDGVTVTFDRNTNHFTFQFSVAHQIVFANNTNKLFGFSSQIAGGYATTIISDIPAKPTSIDDMILSVYGVTPIQHNLDNFQAAEVKHSHIIGMVPLDDIPFGTVRYQNTNGEFSIRLQDPEIKRLRFVVTDASGTVLDYCNLPEFTFIIRFQFISKTDEVVKLLKDIRDYNKYSFISTNLQQVPS